VTPGVRKAWIETLLNLRNPQACRQEHIRIQTDRIDPEAHKETGEFRMIARSLTTDPDLASTALSRFDRHLNQGFHGRMALIKEVGDQR
jgi:hypothetical protein